MSYVWTRFVVPLIRTCRNPPPLGVGSVNSDAMQTLDIEDMDEPKKVTPRLKPGACGNTGPY